MVLGAGGGGGVGAGIGGALGGIIAMAFDKGIPREYSEVVDLWQALESPDFDMRDLSPVQLQVVAEVSPQVYDAIIQYEPTLAETSTAAREAQFGTLSYLDRVAREGLPEGERLAAKEQTTRIGDELSRANEGLISTLQRQGKLDGGSLIQANVGLGSNITDYAAATGDSLAKEAMARRLNARMQKGQLASSIRSQDEALSRSNAAIMNRYGEFVTGLKSQAERDAAAERARAEASNAQNRQRVADFNAQSRYRTEEGNLGRRNSLYQSRFNNDVTRLSGLSDALYGLGGAKDAENAARMNNIREIGRGVGGAAGSAFGFG